MKKQNKTKPSLCSWCGFFVPSRLQICHPAVMEAVKAGQQRQQARELDPVLAVSADALGDDRAVRLLPREE